MIVPRQTERRHCPGVDSALAFSLPALLLARPSPPLDSGAGRGVLARAALRRSGRRLGVGLALLVGVGRCLGGSLRIAPRPSVLTLHDLGAGLIDEAVLDPVGLLAGEALVLVQLHEATVLVIAGAVLDPSLAVFEILLRQFHDLSLLS